MTRNPDQAGQRRHLDTGTILDFLEERLEPRARRRVEDHLARPCAACRARLLELAALTGHMRADRTPEVPAWLHAQATQVFTPVPAMPLRERIRQLLAELVFDSLAEPATAAARRSVGEARRLRFALGPGGSIELELDSEGAHTLTIRGRLSADEAALATIEVAAGTELRRVSPDTDGAFQLEAVPKGPLLFTIDTLAGRWRLPVVDRS